jgi:pentatricopeptide repeat protein
MKFGLLDEASAWHHVLTIGAPLHETNKIKSLSLYCKTYPTDKRVVLETHIFTQNAMINGLAKFGQIDEAKSLYHRCYPLVGNAQALTSIIHWAFQRGNHDTALEFINIAASTMSHDQSSATHLNIVYYNTLISGFAKSQLYPQMWQTIENMPVAPDSSTFVSAIDSLAGSRPSECRPALETIGKLYKVFKEDAGIRLSRRGYILILVRACHAVMPWEAYKAKIDDGGVDRMYDHVGFMRTVWSDLSNQVYIFNSSYSSAESISVFTRVMQCHVLR